MNRAIAPPVNANPETMESPAVLDGDLVVAGASAEHAPVTVIERRGGWKSLDLSDILRSRELLYFLAWRDVKVKYKQTIFGAGWAILQPVVSMLILSVLFGRLVGLEERTGGIPYPVFLFAGLLPWNLFANAMSGAGNSVVASSHVITKIYFPRLMIPFAAVGAALVDFCVAFLTLLILMAFYGVVPGVAVLWLPVLFALVVTSALAAGVFISALNVAYRDFAYVVPFFIQILFYLTPVIYPVGLIPERFHRLMALNPMTGLIDGFRYCLLGQPLAVSNLMIGSAVSVLGFAASVFYFRRVESTFADII